MRILINTVSSKNISGGTFQVAQNFLLKSLEHPDIEWYYFNSKDQDVEIGSHFKDLLNNRYFVFPSQPDFLGSYKNVQKQLRLLEEQIKPDVIYTIVAPSYLLFKSKEVMRFTNPWVTQPNKFSWNTLSLKAKIRTKLWCWVQKYFLRKVHYFITQTDTTKRGLMKITGEPDSHICVVPNVLPALISKQDTTALGSDGWINIISPAVAYPHKNLEIIPDVIYKLQKLGINNVRFHTTLPVNNAIYKTIELKLSNYGLSDRWRNYGIVPQIELVKIYRQCQMMFLPTLLEVFSVSAIEAMYFGLPIVATNFSFNTEVFGDACLYFEPTNAENAASQISKIIQSPDLKAELLKKMKSKLSLYGDYDSHFNAIKEYLIKVAENKI